ncbi:MAG: MerR family transcriptional regulator [Solirubrobacteraceae bacterium]|jgi:hypothetical protein
MAKRETLPTLRGDQAGYVLGGRPIEGFDDRPDLGPRARLILARMAQHYAPETLSDAQRDLLEMPEQEIPQPSERLVDLTRNLEDLDAAHQAGLFDDLSAEEVALIRDPSNHPDLPDARYPLTIGQTAKLTGASPVQLRRWAEARLIPSVPVRGRLHFLGAGVLYAMLLAKTQKYEVSALMRILRGDEAGARLVRLLGVTLASISAEVDESDGAGAELALASATLVRRSETIRKAAEVYSTRTDTLSHATSTR